MEIVVNRHTSLARWVSQSIMLVYSVQRDLLESESIASKVTQIVPTHGVDVRLSNFIRKLGMMFGQETIEILVSNECSLLDDLRIDAW